MVMDGDDGHCLSIPISKYPSNPIRVTFPPSSSPIFNAIKIKSRTRTYSSNFCRIVQHSTMHSSSSFLLNALLLLSSLLIATVVGIPRFGGSSSNNQPSPSSAFPPPPPPPFGPPPPPHGFLPPPPGPPPLPDFLLDVSEKAHREHLQLLMESDGKSKAELREALGKWAEDNGVKEEYDKFLADHEQKRQAYHDLIADNMAGDALAAFNKIWAILENDQISRSTECEQIRAITDGLKVKLRELIPQVAPKIPGPPSPSCFPPPPFAPPPPPPPPPFPKTHHQSFNGNGGQGEGEGQQQQQEVEFSRVTPKKSSKGMKSFEEAKDEQE